MSDSGCQINVDIEPFIQLKSCRQYGNAGRKEIRATWMQQVVLLWCIASRRLYAPSISFVSQDD